MHMVITNILLFCIVLLNVAHMFITDNHLDNIEHRLRMIELDTECMRSNSLTTVMRLSRINCSTSSINSTLMRWLSKEE